MSNCLPRLLSVKEVAEWLGLNPMTVYRKASKGEIPGVKIGKNWVFPEDRLKDWIEGKAEAKETTPTLKAIPGIKLVYLFGSVATGVTTPLSDVDIAYLDDSSETPFDLEPKLEDKIFDLFPDAKRIDLVRLNNAPISIQYRVISEGKLIFKIGDKEQCDFEERVVTKYLDYAPTLDLFYKDSYKNIKEVA